MAVVFCVFHATTANAADYTLKEVQDLIDGGRYDAARDLVASSESGQLDEVARSFVEALILKHQGRLREAADVMQKIVIAHPKFDRVRQELAQAYYLLGDTTRAKNQFKLLADSSQSPVFRSTYNHYIDVIEMQRPWALDGYVALAPSTNVNNGVSADTVFIGGVPLTPRNKKQSGIGLSFGGTGTYRFDLNDYTALSVGASFDGMKYKVKDFDDFAVHLFSELSYKTGDWRFGIGPTFDRTTYGWEGNNFGYGLQGSIQDRVGNGGDTVRLTGRLRYLDYDRVDAFDGVESTIGFRYQHIFSPSMLINVGAYGTVMNARATFNAYKSVQPYVELYTELPWGMLGNVSASYQFRNYDAPFPWTGKNRQDRQLDVGAGVTFRKLSYEGIAPRLEYHFVTDDSNVDLYDFSSHKVGLYLTKGF
ncbi:porin family protein [Rhizobium rhizogenes]|uniref:porin family protein n=1 Tax=Rhizobium rhizogenes TaxID=359 RepID=UPI002270EB85|nr:porin family protein [Rhizobium rhizogenes]